MPRLWFYTAQECLRSLTRFAARLATQVAGQLVTVQQSRRQNSQGAITRQTQVQHSGSISSKTVTVNLLDVLRQTPTLPEILSPEAQKALSATCRSCRLQLIAQVQVVTIVHMEDYESAFECRWPRLCMVILQDTHAFGAPQPLNLTRVIKIYVSSEGNSRASIFMFRPLHRVTTELPWTRLAAQQLAHQMSIRWPLMDSFMICLVHDLNGLGLDLLSQLVKGTWTHLTHLSLSGCKLKAEAFLMLSQGNWPGLKFLSCNCLDADGIALLAKGNWPSLTSVRLGFDPTVDAFAIAHLSVANWPLEEVEIEATSFSTDMAAELADLQLPNLRVLHLVGVRLTAAAVFELGKADWPSLRDLSFGHDDLDAVAALLGLVVMKMQEVKSYAWCHAELYQGKLVSQLGVDLWPNLNWYSCSRNNMQLMHHD